MIPVSGEREEISKRLDDGAPVPVSGPVDGGKTVADYVSEVGREILLSMSNDIYSFGEISHAYGITADVMFAYQNEERTEVMLAGKKAEAIPLELNHAKSHFGLDVFIRDGCFYFESEYDPKCYTGETVRHFVSCMAQAAREFLVRVKLSDVDLVTGEELERLKTSTTQNGR